MNTTTKTAELIRERIEAMPIGEPFTPTAFLECGTRASVDQTLSRLVKAGSIERVTRGVFVRPEVSRFVGKVIPEPLTLLAGVVKHKKVFYSASYANYDAYLAGQLKLIPEETALTALRDDFQRMVGAGMFIGEPPAFDAIIDRLRTLETAINQ